MKVGDTIKIYQDGKRGRDVDAEVIGLRGQRIHIAFSSPDGMETAWCHRRNKKGLYECIGWNYWILPNGQ